MRKLIYKLETALCFILGAIILCAPAVLVTYMQYMDYITYGVI